MIASGCLLLEEWWEEFGLLSDSFEYLIFKLLFYFVLSDFTEGKYYPSASYFSKILEISVNLLK